MGRTVREFRLSVPTAGLNAQINNYLVAEGYEYIIYEGENVYKKGMGLAMGPTFIKVVPGNGFIRVEAWMKFAAVPGGYLGEYDLDSFVGAAVKGPLRTRFATIESMIISAGGVPTTPGYGAPAAGQTAPPPPPPAGYRPPVQQQPAPPAGYRPPYGQPPAQIYRAPYGQAPAPARPPYTAPVQPAGYRPPYPAAPVPQQVNRPPYGVSPAPARPYRPQTPAAPVAPAVNNDANAADQSSNDTVLLNQFCPGCGSKLKGNEQFCVRCGKKVK